MLNFMPLLPHSQSSKSSHYKMAKMQDDTQYRESKFRTHL